MKYSVIKYLAILSLILILFLFFPTFKYQEGLITNSNSNLNSNPINQKSTEVKNIPNSVVANSPNLSTNVINSNSNFNTNNLNTGLSNNTNSINYNVVSSNVENPLDTSSNTPGCDESKKFSIKNVMQDEQGNVIVRYMDTCGKYYTYEYTQSLNHINLNTTPPPTPEPTTPIPTTLPVTEKPPPAPIIIYNTLPTPSDIQTNPTTNSNSTNSNVDSNMINQMVAAALISSLNK